jgi:hypothetical protein
LQSILCMQSADSVLHLHQQMVEYTIINSTNGNHLGHLTLDI